jgi:hypothetical protein
MEPPAPISGMARSGTREMTPERSMIQGDSEIQVLCRDAERRITFHDKGASVA